MVVPEAPAVFECWSQEVDFFTYTEALFDIYGKTRRSWRSTNADKEHPTGTCACPVQLLLILGDFMSEKRQHRRWKKQSAQYVRGPGPQYEDTVEHQVSMITREEYSMGSASGSSLVSGGTEGERRARARSAFEQAFATGGTVVRAETAARGGAQTAC